jgi:hypothetical protein
MAHESLKFPEKRTSLPLGKVRRAHVKAGIAGPTQPVLEAFAQKLLAAEVPIMQRSSVSV